MLNILFNLLILLLVQLLARDSTSKWRVSFGALIATLLVPISIYFPHSFFTSVIGKFIYSFLIIYCAFQFLSVKHFMKLLLSFYFISFGIGGGLIAVHFMMENSFAVSSHGILTYSTGFGDSISWIFVLVGFPIVWLFTKLRMDRHIVDQIRYDEIHPVIIELNGRRYETNGFIDSGNQLTDPITRAPVVICDETFLKNFFTEDEWDMLGKAHEHLNLDLIPTKWKKSVFIVPFKGVEGSQDILFTLRPDLLIVHYNEKKLVTRKVLIGIQ